MAFLGAGISAPLYPLWGGLIADLVEVAVRLGLPDDVARTCRARAGGQPDSVVAHILETGTQCYRLRTSMTKTRRRS